MTQQIINDYPPLFDEIDAAFNVRGKSIIFSFGDRLYNPEGIEIPPVSSPLGMYQVLRES